MPKLAQRWHFFIVYFLTGRGSLHLSTIHNPLPLPTFPHNLYFKTSTRAFISFYIFSVDILYPLEIILCINSSCNLLRTRLTKLLRVDVDISSPYQTFLIISL